MTAETRIEAGAEDSEAPAHLPRPGYRQRIPTEGGERLSRDRSRTLRKTRKILAIEIATVLGPISVSAW